MLRLCFVLLFGLGNAIQFNAAQLEVDAAGKTTKTDGDSAPEHVGPTESPSPDGADSDSSDKRLCCDGDEPPPCPNGGTETYKAGSKAEACAPPAATEDGNKRPVLCCDGDNPPPCKKNEWENKTYEGMLEGESLFDMAAFHRKEAGCR